MRRFGFVRGAVTLLSEFRQGDRCVAGARVRTVLTEVAPRVAVPLVEPVAGRTLPLPRVVTVPEDSPASRAPTV